MDTDSLLNISQLSDELDSGEAIIKFLIKRFDKWITGIDHNGQKLYNPNNLVTLIILLEKINKGILPSEIEAEFNNNFIQVAPSNDQPSFQTNTNLHNRTVEALERRNEIETLKVDALNNIANAIANFETFIPQNSKSKQNKESIKTDDLSILIDTENNVPKIIVTFPIDDLSTLIDENSNIESSTNKDQQIEIDNLASLIEPKQHKDAELDDLSKLIDETPENNFDFDDLSLLINDSKPQNDLIDDLSILTNEHKFENGTIDDLSTLINFKSDKKITILKPEFSPKNDFENYKSEIINIIIDLKNKGLTEEETCEQFNQEGILTFSGKTNWSVKTISQVYHLINNAA